jgi:uncharacterized membrane protein (UPF0127 family)
VQLSSSYTAAPVAIRVRNLTRNSVLCSRTMIARSVRDRSRGLLGRRLTADEGMLFEALIPLMWMHTWFMRFPIDIVFLGRGNIVIKVRASLKPWRFSPMVFGARKALELSEGAVTRSGTAVGDFIVIGEQ